MIQNFTKKPVTIQAKQLTEESCWSQWVDRTTFWPSSDLFIGGSYHEGNRKIYEAYIQIHTLEGTMTADLGDWIIKGIRGEFYPCKPDIFEATYSEAVPVTEEVTA